MLVLSRRLGEGIVIDNHVIATLAVLANDFVEFSLSDIDGTYSSIVTVGKKELTSVVAGVRAVFVRKEGEKAGSWRKCARRIGKKGYPTSS